MKKISRALISVFDKQGVVEFAQTLRRFQVEIISTGGTAKVLAENNIPCLLVSEITQASEILGGRVKTLHPKIFGAILAKRDNADHLAQLTELGISLIDMVVVNLYPFAEVSGKSGTALEEALANIDIGGPTMVRAAAKNFFDVAVITAPQQYQKIKQELEDNAGSISLSTRKNLAVKAFQLTNQYDATISHYLGSLIDGQKFPETISLNFTKIQDLRYGENPHQRAAFYKETGSLIDGITGLEQLHGKELSFNNLLDLDAAVKMVKSFDEPCSVIVKHSNPCGVAIGETLFSALHKALATDTISAFGGIFGFNKKLDVKTAEELKNLFIEVVVAPDYDPAALVLLSQKKNIRLLKMKLAKDSPAELNYKRVAGGLLVQEEDNKEVSDIEIKVVSKRSPTKNELLALKFAWKVVKWVKSNAVIFCSTDRTLGIGAGQMSRIDSSHLAVAKAKRAGLSLERAVVASDAFFPFRDGVDAVAKAGATAIIQPGGSVRDEEVIQAADEHRLALVFTGVRHFRH